METGVERIPRDPGAGAARRPVWLEPKKSGREFGESGVRGADPTSGCRAEASFLLGA